MVKPLKVIILYDFVIVTGVADILSVHPRFCSRGWTDNFRILPVENARLQPR
jgi:hypothetical protein